MGEARGVWESGRCFSGWEWSFVRALLWGREVGVSIYRWGSKTSRFLLFYHKTGWTGPKTGWTGFQKAAHSFLADIADWQKKVNSTKISWTGFHQIENRLIVRLSWSKNRLTVFEYQLNQPENQLNQYLNTGWTSLKTSWTSIFQRAILAKIDLKRLYYILSLRINKGKMEVLDQGFWALVPTPTFFLDPPW
jgi:hypothetical protein